MSKKVTTESFIKRAIKIHGGKYDYSKVVYTKMKNKVIIICKEHEEFLQSPEHHLRGYGCIKCAKRYTPSTEEFIEESIKIHNNKYNYSKVKYVNIKEKVIIICKEHGEFLQSPNKHLNGRGCPKCKGGVKISQEEFIKRAKEKHGDKYNYSKVKYINSRTKVIIICKEHGDFEQEATSHLSGSGCMKCFHKVGTTWSREGFIKLTEKNGNESCLYLLKCYNDEEEFFKIGITSKSTKERFGKEEGTTIPYKYKILKEIKSSDGGYIYDLEKLLHDEYKENNYSPKKHFGGETECFNIDIDLILIDKYLK